MKILRFVILMGVLNLILVPLSWAAEKKPVILDEVVVTATKYATPVKDIPASVTVITSEDIKSRHMPNADMGDVLRSVTGITLRRAYAPFPSYPNIRGVGSDATVVLVNGIPTNWEITQAIPPENIERIEIVRGPASALYGANATGGVINIITREGQDEFNSTVSAGYGSFDTYRFNATTNGSVGRFGLSLSANHEESDGTNVVENNIISSIHMIQDCEYDKTSFSLNTNYHFTENSSLSFIYNFNNNEYTRGRPHVGGDWDRHFAGIIYDQGLGEKFALKGSLGYRYDDLLHLYDRGGTNYDPRQIRETNYNELPIELQLTGEVGGGHTLTAGFFYNDQKTEQDYFDWTTGAKGNSIQKNEYKVKTQAGYLQDVWKPVGALTITAGLRYDHWENYDNIFSNYINPNPGDRTDDNLSPKIGVRYNCTDETSIWTNYSTGYKPPTADQLYDDRTSGGNPRQPNPDLKPEETRSWELGLEQWFGSILQTKLTGFYNYTDDKILSWLDASNVWINKNIGRTKSYGAELDILLQPAEHWTVNANYTWDRAKIDENPSDPGQEGNWLPFSPEHKANFCITYAQKDNLTVTTLVRYLDDQHTDEDNTEYTASGEKRYMEASFVVDLKAVKHFPVAWGSVSNIDLSLSIDNLFDEDYRTFYVYEDPGCVVFGEVSLSF